MRPKCFDRFAFSTPVAVVGALLALVAAPSDALAQSEPSIEACGNIEVEANAMCTAYVDAECMARCEPISFTAACAAQGYARCDADCELNAEASCTADCSASCMGDCTLDPGSFSCRGYCKAQAQAMCEGRCDAMNGEQARVECRESCEATFAGECRAECMAEPPSASCEAKCEASCQGHCTARANLDCQANCQSNFYADCKAELMGGCEAQCSGDGALYCDGQYVDHGDNLEMCADALRELYGDIEVDTSASGSSECVSGDAGGVECEAMGMASASATCAAAPMSQGGTRTGAAVLLAIGALLFLRRRNT